jgi:AcrR family transcriptional regulator
MSEPMRARLFRVAVALFNKKGFRETTVGDIEEAAGLSRRAGGFYRHFSSKEDVLVGALESMAEEMVADIRMEEVIRLNAPRAELLLIARTLIRHAERHRPVRLLVQREGYKLKAVKAAARHANARLAAIDVVPWIENVASRFGIEVHSAAELALVVFGPVVTYIIGIDRADPVFGVAAADDFLDGWATHWSAWLEQGAGRAPSRPRSARRANQQRARKGMR